MLRFAPTQDRLSIGECLEVRKPRHGLGHGPRTTCPCCAQEHTIRPQPKSPPASSRRQTSFSIDGPGRSLRANRPRHPLREPQPLGNANGNSIAITNNSSRILTARNGCVKNTGAVQVKGAIRFPRYYGNFINCGLRIKGSSTLVRCILDANKTTVRVMTRTLRRLSDFCLHRLRLHDSSFAMNQSHRTTGQGGESTHLVGVNMTVLLGYDLVTGWV